VAAFAAAGPKACENSSEEVAMKNRYQVITDRDHNAPTFSTAWYLLAALYVVYLAGPTRSCRIFDAARDCTVKEFDFSMENPGDLKHEQK
jgi:hypothetical protein